MFDIVFGATFRLNITKVHLLIKYLNLEKVREHFRFLSYFFIFLIFPPKGWF